MKELVAVLGFCAIVCLIFCAIGRLLTWCYTYHGHFIITTPTATIHAVTVIEESGQHVTCVLADGSTVGVHGTFLVETEKETK